MTTKLERCSDQTKMDFHILLCKKEYKEYLSHQEGIRHLYNLGCPYNNVYGSECGLCYSMFGLQDSYNTDCPCDVIGKKKVIEIAIEVFKTYKSPLQRWKEKQDAEQTGNVQEM